MKWTKKKSLCNFFKLNALRTRGLSPSWKQNDSPNHVPSRRKRLSSPREQFPPRKKGFKFPQGATTSLGEQLPECLIRKFKGKTLSK
jgi:hypothetical protein